MLYQRYSTVKGERYGSIRTELGSASKTAAPARTRGHYPGGGTPATSRAFAAHAVPRPDHDEYQKFCYRGSWSGARGARACSARKIIARGQPWFSTNRSRKNFARQTHARREKAAAGATLETITQIENAARSERASELGESSSSFSKLMRHTDVKRANPTQTRR